MAPSTIVPSTETGLMSMTVLGTNAECTDYFTIPRSTFRKNGWCSRLEHQLRHFHRLHKRFRKFLGLFAAGLGQVGFAAAAATDDGGDVAHPIAGRNAFGDEILRDAGDEDHFAFAFRRCEEDCARAHLLAD